MRPYALLLSISLFHQSSRIYVYTYAYIIISCNDLQRFPLVTSERRSSASRRFQTSFFAGFSILLPVPLLLLMCWMHEKPARVSRKRKTRAIAAASVCQPVALQSAASQRKFAADVARVRELLFCLVLLAVFFLFIFFCVYGCESKRCCIVLLGH